MLLVVSSCAVDHLFNVVVGCLLFLVCCFSVLVRCLIFVAVIGCCRLCVLWVGLLIGVGNVLVIFLILVSCFLFLFIASCFLSIVRCVLCACCLLCVVRCLSSVASCLLM